jgi:hypothetical protein
METLNFKEEKVQVLTFDQLKRTHKENDIMGKPLKGIYHYELIENISEILLSHNLKMQIDEIFAAQNKDRNQPGVVVLPQVEQQYGQNAVEAHVLRRVFANISIHNLDTDEFTSNLVATFHQNGIQVGFGNMVKVCHNQCILGADRVISNYGKNGMTIEGMFNTIKDWAQRYDDIIMPERETLERMKNQVVEPQMLLAMIGELTAIRVAHDTTNQSIKRSGTYPMNQAQISMFTEDLLVTQAEKQQITVWDVYNAATELYKADRMEIPNVLPQHVAMTEFLYKYMG